MHAMVKINQYRERKDGTDLVVSVPDLKLGDMFQRKKIRNAEIRFDDGRHISAEQRKKAYATIGDIADWTGYLPEEAKERLKNEYTVRTGVEHISLSNCSMDTARDFISFLIEFCLEWGIPLSDNVIERTDDIGRYLYYCLIHKKCAICGKDGEIHHEDAIGMGNDRTKVDDSSYKKICLCREHHTLAHSLGVIRFREMYKVYGIVAKDL